MANIAREKFFAEHQEQIDKSQLEVFARSVGSDLLESMDNPDSAWSEQGIKQVYPPYNPMTGNHYSGVNFLQLALASPNQSDPRWFTPKGIVDSDIAEIEGREAEKEYIVHVGTKEFKPLISTETGEHLRDEDGKLQYEELERGSPSFTSYTLVNGSNTDGLADYSEPLRSDEYVNARLYALLNNSGARFRHGVEESYYDDREDVIYLKSVDSYKNASEYYADAISQLGKWTGNSARLDREDSHSPVGSEAYFREELVNQVSDFMMSVKTGSHFRVEDFKNYRDKWAETLSYDPIQILTASSEANKISKYILACEFDKSKEYNQDNPYVIEPVGLLRDKNGEIKSHSQIALESFYPERADSVKVEEFFRSHTLNDFMSGKNDGDLNQVVRDGGVPMIIAVLKETAKSRGYDLEVRYNDTKNEFSAEAISKFGSNIGARFSISDDKGVVGKIYNRETESFKSMGSSSPYAMCEALNEAIDSYRNEMNGQRETLKSLENSFVGGRADINEVWFNSLRSNIDSNPLRTTINAMKIIKNEGMTASISNYNDQINARIHNENGFTGIELNVDKQTSKAFIVVDGVRSNDAKFSGKISIVGKKLEAAFSDFRATNKELSDKESNNFRESLTNEDEYGKSLSSYGALKLSVENYLKNNKNNHGVFEENSNIKVKEIEQGGRYGLSVMENDKPVGVILYAHDKNDGEVAAVFINPYVDKNSSPVFAKTNGLQYLFDGIQDNRQALKERVEADIDRVSFQFSGNDAVRAKEMMIESFNERPMNSNLAYATISAANSFDAKGMTSSFELGRVNMPDAPNGVREFFSVSADEIPVSQMHIRMHARGNEELILNNKRANDNVAPLRIRGIALESRAVEVGTLRVSQMNQVKDKKISTERTWLDISVDEKEMAKAINRKLNFKGGLDYDNNVRSWYVKAGHDITPFARWQGVNYNPTRSAEEAFVEKLREHGFIIDVKDLKEAHSAKFVRCRVEGDSGRVKSGSYKFFSENMNRKTAGGVFVNFKHGSTSHSWYDKHNARSMTPEEKEKAARISEIRNERQARQTSENQKMAAKVSQKIWAESTNDAHKHGYVAHKQIGKHSALRVVPDKISQEAHDMGIRLADNHNERFSMTKRAERNGENLHVFVKGELLIPAMDMDGTITSVQKVNQLIKYNDSGVAQKGSSKFFLTGGDKTAKFYTTDGKIPTGRGEIIIAEGYATADSVARITGKNVVIAFDAGNLNNVAHEFRAKYPDALITIAADNDHVKEREGKGNAGIYHATLTAKDVGAIVIAPPFDRKETGSDWNDYLLSKGLSNAKDMYSSLRSEALKGYKNDIDRDELSLSSCDQDQDDDFDR